MGMEINEIGNAAGIYQNAMAGKMKDVGKSEESKEMDLQHTKVSGQPGVMSPRHDIVEISDAGKSANALMQAEKNSGSVVQAEENKVENAGNTTQQTEMKKTENADDAMPQASAGKETDLTNTIQQNELKKQGDSSDAEKQGGTHSLDQSDKTEKLSSDKDDEDPTDDLSSLTDTELKQLYLEGDITKTEYDDELAERGIVE